ncbi:MAG: PilC/PilY family type IV pilus protein [Collimonas sp.]|uniref:pilus assembly protein n=1 Tax=Collimonas sp. TaxID=1963772 RepID=UPI0032651D83
MATISFFRRAAGFFRCAFSRSLAVASMVLLPLSGHAATTLSDAPIFSSITVPGNLLLSLSVEYPTALSQAYPYTTNPYTPATTYLGYFDGAKCYTYKFDTIAPANGYFVPSGAATSHACTSTATNPLWSGNWLNWASMQTIDSFRWALTGGYRSVDTATSTILEKAYASGQGGNGETPNKTIPSASRPASDLTGATPFKWNYAISRIWGTANQIYVSGIPSNVLDMDGTSGNYTVVNYTGQSGNKNVYSGTPSQTCIYARAITGRKPTTYSAWVQNSCGQSTTVTTYDSSPLPSTQVTACAAIKKSDNLLQSCTVLSPTNVTSSTSDTADAAQVYALNVRVQVCNSTVGLESNCVAYGSNYKPQGLMQQYAMKIRFGAFGYLNDSSINRDGGVLRANMKYIGPQQPVPGSPNVTNALAEWSSTDGTFVVNPNPLDATASGVTNSGVMNYLNKFGEASQTYKTYDPVSELYYAGIRYYKNLGNWSTYTSSPTTAMLDGFPVITGTSTDQSKASGWVDPILYSCQKNFILGIGDVNTHADANLPGSTIAGNSGYETSTMPTDTTVNVTTATKMVGTLEGVANLETTFILDGSTNFIAGLAYDSHVNDIRPNSFKNANGTKSAIQTISTYWLDVQEYQTYAYNNQFYYATKYGGFTVPANFVPYASTNATGTLTLGTTPATTTALADAMWHTTTDTVTGTGGTNKRPDNYFSAGQADKMVSGLQSAFSNISNAITASGTAFSSTSANVASGSLSYATQYSDNWTGDVIASTVTYDASGNPTYSTLPVWRAQSVLQAQTSRQIVTCCTTTGAGLPFQVANLNDSSQLNSRTNYASFAQISGVGATSQSAANYLAYLRGNQSLEASSSGGIYRTRPFLLGDIVDAKATAVAAPVSSFSNSSNPGYTAYQSNYKNRATVVYVGANDGMMHAFDGSLTTTGGQELFAYVPSFVYGSTANASTTGLASLGRLDFTHHFLVDGTPLVFDIDTHLTNVQVNATNMSTEANAAWKSILIGGLGKGGQGYYAIDVTDPASWSSETAVASKVLWEFTDSHMGYSYGDPVVVKTSKYGWVVILTSGYNNDDGGGYFYIVNPANGALLERVATGAGTSTNPAGLAHASAYVPDFTDSTADSVYAGDLLGNVWRLDLTPSSGAYAAPTKIATLTDSSGVAQPVTTPLLIEIQPNAYKRYVLVGTGKLLSFTDIPVTQTQTFYSIIDGTSGPGAFYTSTTLPKGISFPITRSNMVANLDITKAIVANTVKPMGWYFDLKAGELVNIPSKANSGIVAFAGNLPTGDVCSDTSSSNDSYAVSFSSGQSVLTDSSGNIIASYTGLGGLITDLEIYNVGGKLIVQEGNSSGTVGKIPASFGGAGSLKRLNWREIPTSD